MFLRNILILAAVLTAVIRLGAQVSETSRDTPAAPARSGDAAIQEELEAARAASSVAAYELFIARHPTHPLEAVARAELESLRAAGRR